jgi:hypothetical protein
VLEGAAQPFLFEMVASQALHARLPSDPFIAGQSTTLPGGYDACVETDRLPAFLNDRGGRTSNTPSGPSTRPGRPASRSPWAPTA